MFGLTCTNQKTGCKPSLQGILDSMNAAYLGFHLFCIGGNLKLIYIYIVYYERTSLYRTDSQRDYAADGNLTFSSSSVHFLTKFAQQTLLCLRGGGMLNL